MVDERIFDDIDADLNHFNYLHPGMDTESTSEYYLNENFNNLVSGQGVRFSLIHFNIRSLLPKMDELVVELCELRCNFEVLCFTECWLSDKNVDLVYFENYEHFSTLRRDRRGGGISVFVSQRNSTKILTNISFCCEFMESLVLEIGYGEFTILLGVFYRPPSTDPALFVKKFSEIMSGMRLARYHKIIICGDFNINMMNIEDGTNLDFINTMYSHSLLPMISKPTRITAQTATLIDNIFISNSVNCVAGAILSDISDHLPIFLLDRGLSVGGLNNSESKTFSYRLINDKTVENLCTRLSNFNFESIFQTDDVNDIFKLFSTAVFDNFNICCPVKYKTVSGKSLKKPWINNEILINIKKRQCLYLLYRRGKVSHSVYNRFNNYVTSCIRKAKRIYYFQRFNHYKKDIRNTWKSINSILNKNRMRNDLITELRLGDNTVTGDRNIADTFNLHFSSIGRSISNSVPIPDAGLYSDYLDGNYQNSFVFTPINSACVDSVIQSLKNKRSNIDIVPVVVLKRISFIISPVLCKMFNMSIMSGRFPSSLKTARVVPIYKKGDRKIPSNYRPISIISTYSKIMEKIIYNQIYKFLTKFSILSPIQFGFRSGKSTSLAILHFLNFVYPSLDSNNCVLSVFCDFSKAFDSVNLSILLHKLYHYGIRGFCHDWFKTYLTDRKQYVSISNSKSSYLEISHGVPQGSVLGPLLFLLFINDMPNSSNILNFTLFADDSTLSYKLDPRNVARSLEILNNELSKVYKWLLLNKLKINIDKTNYIIFSYRRRIDLEGVTMGDGVVSRVSSIKFLGVIIDENLNFGNHIEFIKSKVSKSVGVLNKVKYFLPKSILLMLYVSLIEPYLRYCIEVWGSASFCYLGGLLKTQKSAIRIVNNLPFDAHTALHFVESEILTISNLYKYHILLLTYKAVHFRNDELLFNCGVTHSQIHTHLTRNAENLLLPRFNMSKSQKCISYAGPKLYNDIPSNIKNSISFTIFKKKLFKELVSVRS